jgi:hypothetical protein
MNNQNGSDNVEVPDNGSDEVPGNGPMEIEISENLKWEKNQALVASSSKQT